jgi:hypothetical protein
MYVCVCMAAVWCGWTPLSFSLWIVAGMVVAWQDSRAVGEGQRPYCNCRHSGGLEEVITGQGGSYLPRYPTYHKQCIMVSLVYSLIFE